MAVTAQALAEEAISPLPTAADLERAARVLSVAVQMVDDYAPNAPDALKDEAVIRFGGYILGSDYGGVRTDEIGPQRTEYTTNHAAAFRNCGASMLLTRHVVRARLANAMRWPWSKTESAKAAAVFQTRL